MKRLFWLLFFCLMAAQISGAQECKLTDLSKKYDYSISLSSSKDERGNSGTGKVYIRINAKPNQSPSQEIAVKLGPLASDFTDCSEVRSYITGKNADAEVLDNDWGIFIVADFNFDGREDFAIQRDFSNPGGLYEYFTQNKNGRFVRDEFLSETVGYFPDKINVENKTLVNSTNATTAGYRESTFKYNPATKKWRSLKTVHRKQW